MDWQSILVVAIVGLSLLWMIRRVFLGAIGWVRLGGEHRSACGHCTGCSHADQKALVQISPNTRQRSS
jgi:hypothetical protein